MKVIMVGGGTGGHIYPAIAIAEEIQNKILDSQILFIGSEGGIEEKIIPEARFSLATIKARGMLRKLTLRSITSPFFAVAGCVQAYGIIKGFKPDMIVATGGFVSLPVIIAAYLQRVPVFIHEGNVTPGLTTRICKWFAKAITVAFEVSRKHYRWRKVYFIGGPVRREIIKQVKGIAIQNLGLRQDKKILLVLGGSQGARSVNNIVVGSLKELSAMDVQVLHVSGERDYEWIKQASGGDNPFYHLIPYMYNIWDGLAAADLVISRAGATAISEILARKIPSILIPFPFSSEGHQDLNAGILNERGACILINDKSLSKDLLLKEISRILGDKEIYQRMSDAAGQLGRPDAAERFVDIVSGMIGIELNVKKRKKRAKKEQPA